MKILTFASVLILSSLACFSAEASSIKAFKEWKQEKIQHSQSRILSAKVQIEALKLRKHLKPISGLEPLIQHYEKVQAQEQWNLEVAQDLLVTDYVVLYLANQTAKTRFQEAAAQLSAGDVAELLRAYNENLGDPAMAAASVAPMADSGKMPKSGPDLGSLRAAAQAGR